MNIMAIEKHRIWARVVNLIILITFLSPVLVTSFLCQNMIWAGNNEGDCLASRSLFKLFEKKGRTLAQALNTEARLFNLHEVILSGETRSNILEELDRQTANKNFAKKIKFSYEVEKIDGYKDTYLMRANLYKDEYGNEQAVLFYPEDKIPWTLIKEKYGVETSEDMDYAKRGFWIAKQIKSIINPKDIRTGRELVRTINDVLAEDKPKEENYGRYMRIIVTACGIFNEYEPYLNDSGLTVKEEFENLRDMMEKSALKWAEETFARFKELTAKIPNIDNPNEDLFIDVFPDFTDEQIKGEHAYSSLRLRPTSTCGNNCLMCGLSKETGKMRHMPFPMAVKIMRKIARDSSVLILHFNTEPLYYRDKAVNASIADIARFARRFGHRVDIVTHGVDRNYTEEAVKILEDLAEPFDISFHVMHRQVLNYIKDRYEGRMKEDEDKERRDKIAEIYIKRFLPLIRTAIQKDKAFNIRRFSYLNNLPEEARNIFDKYPYAKFAINEFRAIENEVWDKVETIIYGETRETLYRYTHPRESIHWVDDAARLLRDLGIDESGIQEIQKTTYSTSLLNKRIGYEIIIDYDGSIKLITLEPTHGGGAFPFRTIKEMFPDFNSEGFEDFVQLLRLLLSIDFEKQDKIGGFDFNKCDIPFNQMEKEKRKTIIRNLLKEYHGNSLPFILGIPPEQLDLEKLINEVFVDAIDAQYYRFLFSYFISRDEITELLRELNDKNLQRLYERLGNIPFKIENRMSVQLSVNGEVSDHVFHYRLVDEKHPANNVIDTFRSYRVFPIPHRAFSQREVMPSSGQMKGIGRRNPMDEDSEASFTKQEKEDIVASATDSTRSVYTMHDGKTAYIIIGKMKGLVSHHFELDRNIYIVVNMDKDKMIQDEGMFHEIQEIYWIKMIESGRLDISNIKIDGRPVMPQHAAHIIASAEQIQKYAIDAGLEFTPYHAEQLYGMDQDRLNEIKDEDEAKRKDHIMVLEAARRIGARYDIDKIKEYEQAVWITAVREIILNFIVDDVLDKVKLGDEHRQAILDQRETQNQRFHYAAMSINNRLSYIRNAVREEVFRLIVIRLSIASTFPKSLIENIMRREPISDKFTRELLNLTEKLSRRILYGTRIKNKSLITKLRELIKFKRYATRIDPICSPEAKSFAIDMVLENIGLVRLSGSSQSLSGAGLIREIVRRMTYSLLEDKHRAMFDRIKKRAGEFGFINVQLEPTTRKNSSRIIEAPFTAKIYAKEGGQNAVRWQPEGYGRLNVFVHTLIKLVELEGVSGSEFVDGFISNILTAEKIRIEFLKTFENEQEIGNFGMEGVFAYAVLYYLYRPREETPGREYSGDEIEIWFSMAAQYFWVTYIYGSLDIFNAITLGEEEFVRTVRKKIREIIPEYLVLIYNLQKKHRQIFPFDLPEGIDLAEIADSFANRIALKIFERIIDPSAAEGQTRTMEGSTELSSAV